MDNLLLSWSTLQNGGSEKYPSWERVNNLLHSLKINSGCVTIDYLDNEGYLLSELQVRMDNGIYLVTMLDENDEIFTFWDPTQSNDKIDILGDYWPARQLTKDFDFVVKVFKEFFDTGNVSKELLN
ncbi:DUF6911 family protein [Photorhabdus laumondii]|uniref:Uncharacterized protein n=1 Tax=Photorhabdus laumondii subsp. clarkei TaxID=2029685 RepID=A0A329VA33_9GAMM|nr:hypothetical protein [Photorhabdus laumondii]RAW81724.1 hypothetical protein CKY01_22690 [Photorhabdus laumondii subsp. clarkei]